MFTDYVKEVIAPVLKLMLACAAVYVMYCAVSLLYPA